MGSNDYVNTISIIGLSASLSVLSFIAVVMRFVVRLKQKQGLGTDDWLMVPAVFFTIGFGASMIYGAKALVLGYPMGDVTLEEVNDAIVLIDKISFVVFFMNLLGLGFTKLSIVFFYRRIFVTGTSRVLNIFSWFVVGIIVLWIVGFFFTFLFECGTDIALQWGAYEDVVQYCAFIPAINSTFVGADTLVDIILFIVPISLIMRLKMTRGKRFAVLMVFCVGALAVVASLIRVIIFGILYGGVESDFVAPQDIDCTAVITACLPTFQILLRKASTEAISQNILGFFSLKSLSSLAHRFTGATDSNVKHKDYDTTSNEASSIEIKLAKHPYTQVEVRQDSMV